MVRAANRAVFERSIVRSQGHRDGHHAHRRHGRRATARTSAHVGDSRAYLLRAGALRQLTDDHTLVNRMVKAGEITAAEADVHPHRNVLTRALGTEPEVDVDEDDVPLIDGDRAAAVQRRPDRHGHRATRSRRSWRPTPDPQEAADRLIRAANRAGGIDNITVVVLDVHEGDDGRAPTTTRDGAASADRHDRSRERRAR